MHCRNFRYQPKDAEVWGVCLEPCTEDVIFMLRLFCSGNTPSFGVVAWMVSARNNNLSFAIIQSLATISTGFQLPGSRRPYKTDHLEN